MVDQPLAEVPEPDAVDQHPGRQRVLGVGDRLGQLEPAASFLERPTVGPGEHAEEPPRDGRARPARIAADEDVRLDRLGGVVHHHGPRRRTRMGRIQIDRWRRSADRAGRACS